MDTRWKLLW